LRGSRTRSSSATSTTPDVFDTLKPEYDVVLAGDVLEHLLRPQDVLGGAVRLLRPRWSGRDLGAERRTHRRRLSLMRGEWNYRPWGPARRHALPLLYAGDDQTDARRGRAGLDRAPAGSSPRVRYRSSASSVRLRTPPSWNSFWAIRRRRPTSSCSLRRSTTARIGWLGWPSGIPNSRWRSGVCRSPTARSALIATPRPRISRRPAELAAARAGTRGPGGLAQTGARSQAELSNAQRSISRIEDSVTWQAFQRSAQRIVRHGWG